ncbi:MAG: transcriptional repressor LexA [Sphingomonadaceae bacterium]|nr:transcriptional repressor LexA [Sphingomonadaceae bacterium]
MLTKKQHELLCFINDRLSESGVSPSFEEMKEALALRSKSGVHRLINALEERRFIRRLPNRARAIELLRPVQSAPGSADPREQGTNVIVADFVRPRMQPAPARSGPVFQNAREVPLHGRIAAGQPIEAVECAEMLTVPSLLLRGGEHFALQVSGESMVDAGIFDGDYALIQRTDVANDGDIVVALIDGHEATLKYFRREGGTIRLDPANPKFTPQRYVPSRVRVQGRLAGLLRRY